MHFTEGERKAIQNVHFYFSFSKLLFPHSRANVVHQNMCLVTKKRDAKLPNLYVCQNVLRASSSPTSSNYWNRSSTEVENCMYKYYFTKGFDTFAKQDFQQIILSETWKNCIMYCTTLQFSRQKHQYRVWNCIDATNCTNTN